MDEHEQTCWAGPRDGLPLGSPEWCASFDTWPRGTTCWLPLGHEGPHAWTDPKDVILESVEDS